MKRYLHIPVAVAVGVAGTLAFAPRQQIVVSKEPVIREVSAEFFARMHARELAFELLTDKSFKCFDFIMRKESNWRWNAKNRESTARGIGQLLEGTYKNLGMKHSTDPQSQVVAALAYIGRKYGSGGPCAAKSHWLKHGWY